jgi:hypothetical protein
VTIWIVASWILQQQKQFIGYLIDCCCLVSSQQYFSFIRDENIDWLID